MKNNTWVIKGLVLGAVFFIAVLLVKPVGVSTQFSVLSGILHSALQDSVIVEDSESASGYSSTNKYYNKDGGKIAKSIQNPWNYDFVFVLFIPVGGFLAYRLGNKKHTNGETSTIQNSSLPVKDTIKQYALAFIGGFILLYGARMAGGCTSGHMMSGMMQGSISGYIFAAAVFAIAIPTAFIMNKISKGRL